MNSRILKSGDRVVTIFMNNEDYGRDVLLNETKGLKPKILYNSPGAKLINGTVHLDTLGPIVVLWDK